MDLEKLYKIAKDIKKLSPDELKWLSSYLRISGQDGNKTSVRAKLPKPKPSALINATNKKIDKTNELSDIIAKLR